MLVLSRNRNQRIVIGDNIEVVVISVDGDRVKLGFNAPNNVSIHRQEVYLRIQAENARAVDDVMDNILEGTSCPTS